MAREMKDSGIPWIGEIPINWAISRIKNEFFNLDNLREPICAEKRDNRLGLYDYYGASGVIDKIDQYNVDDTVLLIGEDGANLRMRNLPLIYRASGKFWVNNHAHILKVKSDNDYSYMAYLLETGDYSVYITGSAQPKLSQFNLMNFQIVVPPVSEQTIIAKHLNAQCAEIDALLDKTRASIEEYKKLKQAIITQAVTKGIRGDRPMKESGIEWIGEIPAEWSTNLLFQLFRQVKNKNDGMKESNLLSLSYGRIKRRNIDAVEGLLPESFEGYNIIEEKDIVLRLTDLQNDQTSLRVGLSTERGIITSAYLTIRNSGGNIAKYLYYFLHAFDVSKGFYGMGGGVRQGLNWDGVKDIKICIPPIDEQRETCEYLDAKCDAIDYLISKKQILVSNVDAFRKSLIYEYITGKREVDKYD